MESKNKYTSTLGMTYIQDENILVVFTGLLFCALIIYWIRNGDIKEAKNMQEKGLEMNYGKKIRSWRVYLLAGLGILVFLFEILQRLFQLVFERF